jgi:hypothetical protein
MPARSERSVYRRAFDLVQKDDRTDRVASLLRQSHHGGDATATSAFAIWYIHGSLFENRELAVLIQDLSRKVE